MEEVTPWWATKEKCRDKEKRRPGEPGYDPQTLFIPPDEMKKFTPSMC
jgi:DNA mismatch repair protein MSH6